MRGEAEQARLHVNYLDGVRVLKHKAIIERVASNHC